MTTTQRADALRQISLEAARLANRINTIIDEVNEDVGDHTGPEVEPLEDAVGELEYATQGLDECVKRIGEAVKLILPQR